VSKLRWSSLNQVRSPLGFPFPLLGVYQTAGISVLSNGNETCLQLKGQQFLFSSQHLILPAEVSTDFVLMNVLVIPI